MGSADLCDVMRHLLGQVLLILEPREGYTGELRPPASDKELARVWHEALMWLQFLPTTASDESPNPAGLTLVLIDGLEAMQGLSEEVCVG